MILFVPCARCGRTVQDTAHMARIAGADLRFCCATCRTDALAEAAQTPTSASIAATADRAGKWVAGLAVALAVFLVLEQATRPAPARPPMPDPVHTSAVWGMEDRR